MEKSLKLDSTIKKKMDREKSDSINAVINLTPEELIKGIIVSEIIGRPLSKRRRRR